MKKIVVILLIFASIQEMTFGQVAKFYYTSDSNGSEEYLLHHLKPNNFTYFSSANPNGVLLDTKLEMGNYHLLSFPNEGNNFELTIVSDANTTIINCTNPEGKKQTFYSALHTDCYQFGQGNAQETIYGIGPPIHYIYYSTRYPNGVLLKIVGGDMEKGLMKVSFPNDKKVYELTESATNLKCKNPDGSVQLFQIEN